MANRIKNQPFGEQKATTVPVLMNYKYRSKGGFLSWEQALTPATAYRRLGTMSNIKYQTGNDGKFRPCEHSIEQYTAIPLPDSILLCQPLPTSQDFAYCIVAGLQRSNHIRNYAQFLGGVGNISVSVDSIDWNGLSQQALSAMMPTFGGQNSLINFIVELRDFRSLATALWTKSTTWLRVLQTAVGYKRRKSSLKNLSSAYLSYSFAWRPLYSDLVSLVSTILRFEERYRSLVNEANTDLQKHYSITVNGTAANQSQFFYSGDTGPQGGWTGQARPMTRQRVIQDATEGVRFTSTLRYRYPLPPELAQQGGQAKAWLDALGIAGDPAIIWNAIPFSFVVDWVVGVGRWLSQMRIDNIRFKTEIRDFCSSAVITRNIRYEQQAAWTSHTPTNTITYNWGAWQTTDTCRKRRYVRRRGLPNFLQAVQTSGLNWREFSLGGALLSANTGTRPRGK